MAVLLIQVAAAASEDFWACFGKGAKINYCNPKVADRTCDSEAGCKMCMSSYNATSKCYNQGNWNLCSTIVGSECQTFGNGTLVDSIAPDITLVSPNPNNSSIFTSTRIPLKITLDERGDLYYLDNIYGRGRWVKICSSCNGIEQLRSFKEGANDITFRATDSSGNKGYQNVRFFIDSKQPKFNKVEPKSGFASGEFYTEFTEANPKKLTLNYGTSARTEKKNVNLATCIPGRSGKMACDVTADVSMFNSQEIQYWFEIEDIAANKQESKRTILMVDTVKPVISGFNYTILNTKATFSMNINELNFDEVTYIDHADSRPMQKRFCTRLKDSVVCSGYKTFRPGFHNLTFTAYDDAGNTNMVKAKFTIY